MEPGQKAYETYIQGHEDAIPYWTTETPAERARWAAVEAACAPQLPDDVAVLVERLSIKSDPESRDAYFALQAQAAENERLRAKVLSLEVELSESVPAHKWQRVKTDAEKFKDQVIDTCKRAEAAEAKLREAVEVMREIADSDDIDNALDPERNKRIARAFLSTMEPTNDQG